MSSCSVVSDEDDDEDDEDGGDGDNDDDDEIDAVINDVYLVADSRWFLYERKIWWFCYARWTDGATAGQTDRPAYWDTMDSSRKIRLVWQTLWFVYHFYYAISLSVTEFVIPFANYRIDIAGDVPRLLFVVRRVSV